jgi:hypothetical protein
MLKVEIPVKGYIRNYVEANYGTPVLFDRRTYIGKHFFALAASCDTKYDKMYKGYKDILVVHIKEDMYLRRGSVLTKTGILDFNGFVEDIMKRELFIYVDGLTDQNPIQFKEAFQKYIDRFQVDEALFTYDNIKQTYQRYRKKDKTRKKA